MLERIKQWARTIKRDVIALWIAARDPRVPWYAKALAAAIAAYALSPIDLIPDFIPVLGYLDELVIPPVGNPAGGPAHPGGADGGIPRAGSRRSRSQPRSTVAAVVIVTIWIAAAALAGWWLWRSLAA